MVPLMGISLSSYRKWEQGTRDVSGPAATFSRDRKGTGSGETRLAGFGPELTPPRLLAKPTFSRRIGPAKPRENGTSADPVSRPGNGDVATSGQESLNVIQSSSSSVLCSTATISIIMPPLTAFTNGLFVPPADPVGSGQWSSENRDGVVCPRE